MRVVKKILWSFSFLTALIICLLEFQYGSKPFIHWEFFVFFVLPFLIVPIVHLSIKKEKIRCIIILCDYVYLSLVWAGLALTLKLWVLPIHWVGAVSIFLILGFLTDSTFKSYFQSIKQNRKEKKG